MARPLFEVYAAGDLPDLLYRMGTTPIFTADDFLSYAAEGKAANAPYIQQLSVSMYLGLEQARQAVRELRYRHGRWLAELDLREERWATWCLTNPRRSHVEVWAPADVLVERVQEVHSAR